MTKIISISELKKNAANIRDEALFSPIFVTQNGNGALVIQSTESYRLKIEKIKLMEDLLNE